MTVMDINKIAGLLEINIPKENIILNEPMRKHTTFKIGGNADIFVKAYNIDEVKYVLKISKENNIPLTVVGNGSNILVKDNGIRGIVLKINIENFDFKKDENNVIATVGAGMLNARLSKILLENEIQGFEFASGIPGTIGGAIRMNAGAYGFEFKDIILETTYLDLETGDIRTLTAEEQDFSYRHSIFAEKHAIILGAKFILKYGNKEEIANKIKENLLLRKGKQPIEYPSAGSTFKRGTDFITAKLIDECGLKGKCVGDAQVSEKHAGFIINKGNAKAEDVITLVEEVKKVVLELTGKEIELEVVILGE